MGQPIFGLPGTVSLIELRKPVLCNYFSDSEHTVLAQSWLDHASPIGDVHGFMLCVTEIVKMIDSDTLLLVNTGGWVDGLGAEVLQQLSTLLKPHGAISMLGGKSGIKNEFAEAWKQSNAPIIEVNSDKSAIETMNVKGTVARNKRFMNALLRVPLMANMSPAYQLCSHPSVFISFDKLTFLTQDEICDSDEIEALYENLLPFNRQIVALMIGKKDTLFIQDGLPRPNKLWGCGLIRDIDLEGRGIHLVAASAEQLPEDNLIVKQCSNTVVCLSSSFLVQDDVLDEVMAQGMTRDTYPDGA